MAQFKGIVRCKTKEDYNAIVDKDPTKLYTIDEDSDETGVYNAKVILSNNGVEVGHFTVNQSLNSTINFTLDLTPTVGSANAITSGAVKTYVDAETTRATTAEEELDDKIDEKILEVVNSIEDLSDRIDNLTVSQIGANGSYIKLVSETSGIISATAQAFDTTITDNANNAPTTSAVKSYVDNIIENLDVTKVGVENTSVLTTIEEANGKIITTKEDRLTEITGNTTGLVTEGAIKTYVDTSASTLQTNINTEKTRAEGIEAGLNTRLNAVENKIPEEATYENKLADKAFVNSSIENLAAFYVTKNAAGEPFATKAELLAATEVYIAGAVKTPGKNDYCIVTADESKATTGAQNPTTRYIYTKANTEPYSASNWAFQYIINNTGLTSDQLKAVNSGITTEKRESYDSHITNTSNPHQVTKSQVGLGNVVNAGLDDIPTENSDNYVKSGGVYTKITAEITRATTAENTKMNKVNPTGTGSLSINRTENSTIGAYSTTLGNNNIASGESSIALGSHTIAQRKSQVVSGEYNIADTTGTTNSRGTYIEIVGNGTSSEDLSNARTLDWSGNEVLKGKLTVGTEPSNVKDVTTKGYVDNRFDALDLTQVGGTKTFIKDIKQVNGQVSATAVSYDTEITTSASNDNLVSTLAVKNYVDSKESPIKSISINGTLQPITNNNVNLPGITTETQTALTNETTARESGDALLTNRINALDLTTVGQNGYYIKTVAQENGQLSATKEQFDQSITSASTNNNAPTSLAVYTELAKKVNKAGDTMNGALTFTSQSSAINNNNIVFSSGGTIGGDTSGNVGIDTENTIQLSVDGNGIANVSTSGLIPENNSSVSLGSSALQWNKIYGANLYQNGNSVVDISTDRLATIAKSNYTITIKDESNNTTTFESSDITSTQVQIVEE